jgi:hypothetical protein
MSLLTLIILVIGGIATIALLLHLSGRSRRRVMTPEDARAEWHRHFPDDEIAGATVTPDGHAALILTRDGPARAGKGLVWAMGTDTTARRLLDFDITETAAGLSVRFHDFTAPRVTLHLPEAERARWITRMDPT